MSFTSTLPTALLRYCSPGILLKGDTGTGFDTVTFLESTSQSLDLAASLDYSLIAKLAVDFASLFDVSAIYHAGADLGVGSEYLLLRIFRLRDSLIGAEAPVSLSRLAESPLYRASPGRIIHPDDHNALVYYWRMRLGDLGEARAVVSALRPDLLSKYDSMVNSLKEIQSRMPLVRVGDYVACEHFNDQLDALDCFIEVARLFIYDVLEGQRELAALLSEVESIRNLLEKRLKGDIISSLDRNTLIDALEKARELIGKVKVLVPTVYILKGGDWATARTLITDYSIVCITENIAGVHGSDLKPYLDSYKCVVVNAIDTYPYYPHSKATFRDILYTVDAPFCRYCDSNIIVDSCFRKMIGSSTPALWDYFTPVAQKLPSAISWAVYTGSSEYSWSYVKHAKGYVIEVPHDGMGLSLSVFEKYVDAITRCLLGASAPIRLIYLGWRYARGGAVDVWALLRELAKKRGWRLVDLTQ